jgi:hypothetical protein
MRALSAPEILEVWERGLVQSPIHRLLTLLAAATGDSPEDVAWLTVGQRDARLLTLREWTFGPEISAVATCPGCGGRLEMSFTTEDVRVSGEAGGSDPAPVNVDGYELRCRAPNSVDLAAIAELTDGGAAREELLRRCVVDVQRGGLAVNLENVSADAMNAAIDRLAQADPQAAVTLLLQCPSCDRQSQMDFDIGSFFLDEIQSWAQRILREVHVLASTYGWRELDILTMSPWRRRFYRECTGQ